MEPEKPKKVGRAYEAPRVASKDPQAYLQGSNHPYAPFTGNAFEWASWAYDDGTTYEGLSREGVPHMKGTMIYGKAGAGGGITDALPGDKYEGEFTAGFAHGLGQYSNVDGEIYRGEFVMGKKNGCGSLIDLKPFLASVGKGGSAAKAWKTARPEIERNAVYGTWNKDLFVATPDESGEFCHINEIKGMLQELDEVLTKTRMFRWKPDGEVTFRFAQDGVGLPAPLMQHPLHYPHGTGFMAPGPAGQTHALPDDDKIKKAMLTHARNHERIYNSYNFDLEPAAGSDMAKALKHWAKIQKQRAARLKRLREREERRIRRVEASRKPAIEAASEAAATSTAAAAADEELSEDDLLASLEGVAAEAEKADAEKAAVPVGSVFASVSLSAQRAAVGISRAARAAQANAWRVASRAQARPRLVRPSDL